MIQIVIPPLRERREDLPALCAALLQRIAHESGMAAPALSDALLEQLASDPLPGNVRELENLLHRALALSEPDELRIEPPAQPALPQPATAPANEAAVAQAEQLVLPNDLQGHLDSAEREILVQALRETGFNRTAAAARLGLSLRQIRYRIARLQIAVPHGGDAADEPL